MQPRLGIYIHIPFCASKCGYCDFYSCAGAAERMAEYQQALLEHIEESAGRIAPAYIDTVYFGGGTPSFYGAARLIELLDAVKATGRLLKRAEVTVEVNPDSVRLHDLRALRKAGFNRLSLGMQAAVDLQNCFQHGCLAGARGACDDGKIVAIGCIHSRFLF